MEVAVAVHDFHFDSTCTSPYVSTPSSPTRLGGHFDLFRHYTSAPTSPTRASSIYAHFDAFASGDPLPPPDAASGVPFDWEEKPGTPKSRGSPAKDDVFDFAFDSGGHCHKEGSPVLITADELFEEGMIRPLKPPPRLQCPSMDDRSSLASSPRSPKPRGLWSPRNRGRSAGGDEFDPFAAALAEATRDRWRERKPTPPSRKASRSLSPLRSFFRTTPNSAPATATAASPATPKSSSGGSKKWRLRDLLLFRSASEGRKYSLLSSSKKVVAEDVKNSSFRSTDSSSGMSARRGSGRSSFSHEMHYAASRAASEELKKKTALPYQPGFFGCLRFNPAVLSLSRGFNGHSFGRG
ncbi:hypothetical protein Cni_G03021 [Canna indica]|uniref:Calmodulin-binding protein n=1 Tax=Canna indica TaxID=4628 RepID=A0AAQ3JSV3_9LILI|nr:hypothetical protein Cni_G03021 [Canna indica]